MQYLRSIGLAALLAVGVIVLASTAEAQQPTVTQTGLFHGHAGTCCEPVVERTCVATVEKKKHVHTCYSSKQIEYCLPSCKGLFSLFRDGHGACGDCAPCATCEQKPRCKAVLIKKFVTEEKDVIKCVPQCAAPCVPTHK